MTVSPGQALVIGLGKSGMAAARLLQHQGWQVTLSDRSSPDLGDQLQALRDRGIALKLGHQPALDADRPDRIVVSPGVPWDLPYLGAARSAGIETLGEMELAWRTLKHIPWVSITGTNGKTTTTSLIAAILQTAGLHAPACGNIGAAACDLALAQQDPDTKSLDWVVAEVSSYQSESADTLRSQIALWTTFTPDHLNRHYTLDNYYEMKARLLRRSRETIFNADDPYLRSHSVSDFPQAHWTSTQGAAALPCAEDRGVYLQDAWVKAFGELIMPLSLFPMQGNHNHQNLLMAVGAARLAGIEKGAIAEAMASFTGVPHRLEAIRTFQGIALINDSKATNYDAALVGLRAVTGPVVLIAGGEAKEGDDRAWIAEIKAKCSSVLLIGDAATQFDQRLKEAGYEQTEIVETMERAVVRGADLAKSQGAKTVLLSPACASFDQYRSFEHRGDHFRQLCQAL